MKNNNYWIYPAMVFIFLNALGFPGSYENVFGHSFEMLVEYTSFLLQAMIMLITSANNVMDIKLINLKTKYTPVYLFLLTIFFCSMLVTCSRSEQLISCIRISVTAMFALWLCDNLSLERILTEIYHAQIIYVFLSILFPVAFPAYDIRGESYREMFVGIGGVKNVTAEELSFGILVMLVLWVIKEKKNFSIVYIGVFVLQCILLIMTEGTGAIAATLAVGTAVIMFNKNNMRFPLGLIYVIGTIGFIIVAMTSMQIFGPFLESIGEDATLTGRIPLWTQAINVMTGNKTMTGYGYGMFWRDPEALSLMHEGFSSDSWAANMRSGAHNNLIELWMNDGLLGILSFFYMMISSFNSKMPKSKYLFCFAFMTFYMINGWTERLWTTYEYGVLIMFMTVGLGYSREEEENAETINNNTVL